MVLVLKQSAFITHISIHYVLYPKHAISNVLNIKEIKIIMIDLSKSTFNLCLITGGSDACSTLFGHLVRHFHNP